MPNTPTRTTNPCCVKANALFCFFYEQKIIFGVCVCVFLCRVRM